MPSRRQFLQSLSLPFLSLLALSSSFTHPGIHQVNAAPQINKNNIRPELGVHLPLWHQGELDPDQFWKEVYSELNETGISQCLILNYYFVDPVSAKISKKSQFNSNHSPKIPFLEKAMQLAPAHNIKASLYPVLEIDNPHQIGAIWRGNLNFFGVTLKNFFNEYSRLIMELAQISVNNNAQYIYLGSELASLTHNIAARPFWEQLLYDLHSLNIKGTTKMTYAAHWEEYLTFPFWRQLDSIGIDAYFPLASAQQSAGINNPSLSQIAANLKPQMNELYNFARQHQRPLHLSEFGLTPFDQATTTPWQQFPSYLKDESERLNSIKALLNCLENEVEDSNHLRIKNQPWLSSVNFWHWKLPGRNGSNYNIEPGSNVARLIKNYSEKK